ncbi:MAG: NTP transferase domain-containing protein [Candidatus Zixiibacteriota bacterium]
MQKNKAALVLAAGKGKRMKSDLPKVLHQIDGKSLIRRLMETLTGMDFDKIAVVVGHKGEMVIEELSDFNVEFVWQNRQLGTGHAVQMAESAFKDFSGTIMVTLGDAPFLTRKSIEKLFEVHLNNSAVATCLTAEVAKPKGYGRIVRKDGSDILLEIVEEKDASPKIQKISEINSGTFCFNSRELFSILDKIQANNSQKEYYLTDTIKIFQGMGKTCAVWRVPDSIEAEGINDIDQLKKLEDEILKKKN